MTVSDDDLSSLINEELLARRTKVMYLKNAGATWAQIAQQVGVSIATCRKDMAIVQRDINNEQPSQVVARHRAVIFDIQRANYPAMMRGDKDAAMVILRALHREANLLGLDSPTRVLAAVSAEDFANEAARLIESITSKDADTLKELTSANRPITVEEVPLPEPEVAGPDQGQPPAVAGEPDGPAAQPPGGSAADGRAPTDAPERESRVPGQAGLPDLPDDDGWSNL
ncbi:helix-turn-helix DNA-binding protein [Mycobacterium phage KayaCho]|uniref:Rnase E n=1 Tax=Mycobacterium phage KayaCho TaxID=1340830 RepID=UPI0003880176|nr:Rnase E [Mycobacterium phage KayaCho]AGT12970.1 helix-turn-helix DNA-binding protein [Mycobacterium phage KayaCho]